MAGATVVPDKVTVSDEVSRYVLDLARQVISPQQRQGGSFADPIELGPDAHSLDRLIASSPSRVESRPEQSQTFNLSYELAPKEM